MFCSALTGANVGELTFTHETEPVVMRNSARTQSGESNVLPKLRDNGLALNIDAVASKRDRIEHLLIGSHQDYQLSGA